MTDDFFDNFDEGVRIGGDIGAFLKRGHGGAGTDPNGHPDVVDTNKLLTQDTKGMGIEDTAAASYSESFETENNKSESFEKENTESEASSECSETAHGSHVASASQKSETPSENIRGSSNNESLQQESQKTPKGANENDQQQGTLSQSTDDTHSKPERIRFQKQRLNDSEASGRESKGSAETVRESFFSRREEKKRQVIREWIERKTRESLELRKEEARKMEERTKQEEEETERKKIQEERRRQRTEVELKEWHSRKARYEKEAMIRLQEEAEEMRRVKEERAARSTHIYLTWLAAHPSTSTHHHTAHAFTGDRLITYYDRSNPAPPVYRNPEPWRR